MVLIMVSIDRGGPWQYTGSKSFRIENLGRGLQQPRPFEEVLQNIPLEDEG